jgi:hypothetical protein
MIKKPSASIKKSSNGHSSVRARIEAEMLDSFDEELELEIDDDRLDELTNELSGHSAIETVERRVYFKELFRLQGELVKLQSWVQHNKLKVVVIFEGRDSAGKGGVISAPRNGSIRASAASPRCRLRTSASAPNGISSAMFHICPPAAKSCCSIAAGTTAPVSNG